MHGQLRFTIAIKVSNDGIGCASKGSVGADGVKGAVAIAKQYFKIGIIGVDVAGVAVAVSVCDDDIELAIMIQIGGHNRRRVTVAGVGEGAGTRLGEGTIAVAEKDDRRGEEGTGPGEVCNPIPIEIAHRHIAKCLG